MFTRFLARPSSSFFLFGPRGTGKTTWIDQQFPSTRKYDLLLASESIRLGRDPSLFTRECGALDPGSWVVVDEIQKVPALLDEVHHLIERRKLRFVLSGSSARKIKQGGANLLAGRAEVRRLFPFVSAELPAARGLEEILTHGMLPLAVTGANPQAFLKAYVETYLAEEIRAEAIVRQIGSFARFLEVAARMNGQTVNASGVARDALVARQTAQDYFQVLVDTLIGFLVPAWKAKRAVKQVAHSKFFLFDCGVARHMGGLGHLAVHPEERGALFETYLLHEIRAFLHYRELDYPLFFYRTRAGLEVDLIVETRDGLVALEMKSGIRWERKDGAGLREFSALHAPGKVQAMGVYAGPRQLVDGPFTVYPWSEFLQILWEGKILS